MVDKVATKSEEPKKPDTKVKSKKSNKKLMMIAGIVLAVFLVVGAGYAVIQNSRSPDEILSDAINNSLSAESVKFTGNLDFQAEGADDIFSGIELQGQASNSGDVDMKLTLNLGIATASAEVRSINGVAYIQFDGVAPLVGLAGLAGEDVDPQLAQVVSGLDGQWITLDPAALGDLTQNLLPDELGEVEENLDVTDAEVSQEDIDRIRQALEDNLFITVSEEFDEQEVDGKASYHYKVTIDRVKLTDFVNALKGSKLFGQEINDETAQEVIDGLNTKELDKQEIEIWVDKGSDYISKISIKGSDDDGDVELSMNFSDYNSEINIEEPQDAKSILEVLTGSQNNLLTL